MEGLEHLKGTQTKITSMSGHFQRVIFPGLRLIQPLLISDLPLAKKSSLVIPFPTPGWEAGRKGNKSGFFFFFPVKFHFTNKLSTC